MYRVAVALQAGGSARIHRSAEGLARDGIVSASDAGSASAMMGRVVRYERCGLERSRRGFGWM